MCGIAGFVGAGDRSLLERMTAALAHRGPDAQAVWIDAGQGVHLGHRRLSILDIEGGAQPMGDGDLTIVFNGEIYNFRELRAELERMGARFRSGHSDTEVLLHGYRAWGESLPERLNGMWAFVIHDRRTRRLFCSRDRFGKKPFYFHYAPGRFVFASELKALRLHPEVPAKLDTLALRKYFAYGFVPAPATLQEGVRKLPGGCSLVLDLDSGRLEQRRYWRYDVEPDPALAQTPDEALVEELAHRLDRAISRRLVADVPVGLFLSGGVDSSTVAALALRQTGRDRLRTFSIGFDEASFDESQIAATVAAHIGADHQVRPLGVDDARALLPRLLDGIDEPVADSSILPTWLLCGFAREQVTVALGGDGAYELFAGYDPFKALRYARWYSRLVPRPLHRAIVAVASHLPVSHRYMSFDFRLKRLLRGVRQVPALRLPVWLAPASESDLAELFAQPVALEEVYSEAIGSWERCPSEDEVDRAATFFVDLYLQDDILVKVDRASMLHSLEVRAPFLDIELVDFVRRLPSRAKLRRNRSKWLLKQLASRLLPDQIVNRRKQGFALPVGRWLADGKLGTGLAVPPPRAAVWVRRLAEHRAGRADHRLYLWSEIMLSGSRAMEGVTTTPAPSLQ